jgi:low temperature requirement protein LtrA
LVAIRPWFVALALELAGPWLYFAVPGLGRSSTSDWIFHGGHLAERCGLFVIIALGESLLVTGATFARMPWTEQAWAAFLIAVLGSILLWWIYFDTGAPRGEQRISNSENPGRLARLGYIYLHVPIVAGIIACAVADEIMLLHPGHTGPAVMLVLVGGPAGFLTGAMLFKWVISHRRRPPRSHLVGLGLLGLLFWVAHSSDASSLQIGASAVGVLLVVAGWESLALRRRPRLLEW